MPAVLEQPTPILHKDSVDLAPWLLVLFGLAAMYGPSFYDLFRGIWSTDEQAHGPIVMGVSAWLIYRSRSELFGSSNAAPRPVIGWALLVFGCLLYAVGRSQGLLLLEVGSLIVNVVAIVLLLRGPQQLKTIYFALFFMLFMVPLPGTFVDAVTHPMKMAVSYVAEHILFAVGYPIARTGVILQIGPYQLLVADACAGLHTLFTLEALGLLYLNVVKHASLFRNVVLAVLIIPISFAANVIRVIVLTLVTYHFGDEAGQGFVHGFAGMVLFVAALLLIMGVDGLSRMTAALWNRKFGTNASLQS
ncbi:exosortase B [Niveibacterium sp. 24ML]|uniref:exosortase B n=1 Tax=Niveibacterium sp. 24ML TaxID=2985512 RepID=UPI002270CE87|nr:exosortase B [Niveibacterium sp. 24ML]MCX9156657.1 exosortase B [Niveibacterium sp. 24ML]